MLNYIWIGLMLLGLSWGTVSGSLEEVTKSVIDSSRSGVKLSIELLGMMCLWSGLMRIAQKSGMIDWIANKSKKIFHVIFPEIPQKQPALGAVVLNLFANFFGLGNAATPLGIKAMEEMQKLNAQKDTASNDMIMFMVINASCIQFIPTTVIAIREMSGSESAASIIPTVWFASACSTVIGVVLVLIFQKTKKFERKLRGSGGKRWRLLR